MYSYIHDPETGGLLLTSSPTKLSLEPRPVYAPELDMLKLSQRWKYLPQTDAPYMWAESNTYIYRGVKVAVLHGGDLYHAPEVEITPEGEKISELLPVDIDGMCLKNEKLLTVIERSTVRRITKVYEQFAGKVDIFHVAFSGGKDSAVLLDLVKKALPEGSFVVVFGDTGMEFPDTYKAVRVTRNMCRKENIPFYRSESRFSPSESWRMFGPPARVLRWCCSVHKSAPQTLKLREFLSKKDFTGLDFVGVRSEESEKRRGYKYLNYSEKQKGQWSHNSILNWTSAEVWLYIYAHHIFVNEAYKKGNSRAGCLLCPMCGGYASYARRFNYTENVDEYVKYIQECYNAESSEKTESYVLNGGWNARRNGRDFKNNPCRYFEDISGGTLTIKIIDPVMKWTEWMKTLGEIMITRDGYSINFQQREIFFRVKEIPGGFIVSIPEIMLKKNPSFVKFFKQVFRKSAYCVACGECEANCQHGCIKFEYGRLSIEDCMHCMQCHDIEEGCLMFASLRHPQGGGNMKKSLNSFADHAPKTEWLTLFFELKDDFFGNHGLGPMMYDMFRRFLKDAELNDKNHFTEFAELIASIGWEKDSALGLMLTNLAYHNPQIEWYINNFDIGKEYERAAVEGMLTALNVKPKDAKSIVKAYKRIVATPFGTVLHFGHAGDETLTRTECTITDNKVLLYALYKFAEKCNLPHEIHLPYLFDDSIDRDGPTPVRIFGLKDDDSLPISERSRGIRARLLGLSAAYPEYINVTFTNDLQTITLRDKTSQDILNLFRK